MFQKQAARLLRRQWSSPTELAEELVAMFRDEDSLAHKGPIDLNGPTGVKVSDSTTNRVDIGDEDTAVYINGELFSGSGATNVFLGKVVGGSGDTYSVEIYANGSGQAATDTVTATVPQIDPDEEIPAETWIDAVHKFGSGDDATYEFQPPVWIDG
jgi:hypothetical protein